MERLTSRDGKGRAYFDDDGSLIRGANGTFHQKKDMTAHFIHQRFVALDKVIDCLAAYEDTGLTPEEVADLAKAKSDGRLVVLPCKKGDVLWSFYNWPREGIYSFCVTATSTLNGVTVLNTDRPGMVFLASDIGKTVFLTREEAKAALAKRKEKHE